MEEVEEVEEVEDGKKGEDGKEGEEAEEVEEGEEVEIEEEEVEEVAEQHKCINKFLGKIMISILRFLIKETYSFKLRSMSIFLNSVRIL